MIETALSGTPGVLYVDVGPAAGYEKIVVDVLKAVTHYNVSFLDVYSGAYRVALCHKFMWGAPPTIVLSLRDCRPNQAHAEVEPAVRNLIKRGYRVLVDSSDNSLPRATIDMSRTRVLRVDPMSREVLETLRQLQSVLKALREAGESELAWSVLGGVPGLYEELSAAWVREGCGNITPIVDSFLRKVLREANKHRVETGTVDARIEKLYLHFKEVDSLPSKELKRAGITLQSSHKVLRAVVLSNDEEVLQPATSAMRWVLKYGSEDGDPPSLSLIRSVLEQQGENAPPEVAGQLK